MTASYREGRMLPIWNSKEILAKSRLAYGLHAVLRFSHFVLLNSGVSYASQSKPWFDVCSRFVLHVRCGAAGCGGSPHHRIQRLARLRGLAGGDRQGLAKGGWP